MSALEPLLIEIGTEELPPLEMQKLSNALCQKLSEQFTAHHLPFGPSKTFVSPRRLAVLFESVPTVQPNKIIEKKGPPIQAAFDAQKKPTQALLGFAKSVGASVEDLKTVETDKGTWFVYQSQETGRPTAELLPALLKSVLSNLPANKTMRWGDKKEPFVRPVHWIVLLHGGSIIPFEAFGITSDRRSFGHRVHAQQPISLARAHDYEKSLLAHFVIADFDKRQEKIKQEIIHTAEKIKANALIDAPLLSEVCGLTEWPTAYLAHFSESFLAIPKEALISAMQKHQRCFAVMHPQTNALLPCFILISNLAPTHPDNILHGNERVMNARLTDAKFFYEQDKLTSLESRLDSLKHMIFQKKLGTLYDKSQRLAQLTKYIGAQLNASPQACERAGLLCKTDLLTHMVGEFPELQGIMGHYYALHDGENPTVAMAIESHYYPRFSKDTLPTDKIGLALALADRIDTLVGTFGSGFTPSSDKDPYGLRRAALGVIRLMVEPALDLDLSVLLSVAIENYGALLSEPACTKLMPFMMERFRAYCLEKGISSPVFDAVLANTPTKPYDFYLRLTAVSAFIQLDEAEALANAFKRVNNILVKSAPSTASASVVPTLLSEPAEIALFEKINQLMPLTEPLIENRQYELALNHLATIKPTVDAFFETVMVNVETQTIRDNRLHLLSKLKQLFVKIADIALLS